MFVAALFTIAKTWKQPKCPQTDELIKMCYVYIMEYQPQNKNEIMPFAATWMVLKIIILSEVSQRQISYNFTYMWNLKYDTNELIYKTETDSQTQKTNLWLPKGQRGESDKLGDGINIYTLLYIKQITNKDLLYSIGNSTQYSAITYMEKNLRKNESMYMYN